MEHKIKLISGFIALVIPTSGLFVIDIPTAKNSLEFQGIYHKMYVVFLLVFVGLWWLLNKLLQRGYKVWKKIKIYETNN